MTPEQLLKHRYQNRFGDKWDRVAKLFDYYDMIDFAEAYTRSQFPTEKEMEQEFREYLQIDTIPDKDDPEHYDYSWGRVVWMACYDHIKKLFER